MKKNLFLKGAAFLMVAASFFTGCKKDDETVSNAPTVSFIPNQTSVSAAPGSKYQLSVTYEAALKLKSITVYKKEGSNTSTYKATITAGFNSDTKHIETYSLDVPTTGSVDYTFEAIDKNDQKTAKTLTVTATGTSGGDYNTYTVVLLGNQNSSAGSFYSTATNRVYTQTDAKANSTMIDILHYYGANNKATLASPADGDAGTIFNNPTTGLQTWGKRNDTKFGRMVGGRTAYDAITSSALIATAASNANSSAVTNLQPGELVTFRTEAGKYGVAYISEVSGSNTVSGSIKFDVKVQK